MNFPEFISPYINELWETKTTVNVRLDIMECFVLSQFPMSLELRLMVYSDQLTRVNITLQTFVQ